jgi:hypothetical protein
MSLPARQQRMLNGIEAALQASEPQLASMFAVFARLTEDEGPAETERLSGFRLSASGNVRAFLAIPVLFALLISGALLAGASRGPTSCGAARLAGYSLTGSTGQTGRQVRRDCSSATKTGRTASPSRPAAPVTSARPAGHSRPGAATRPGAVSRPANLASPAVPALSPAPPGSRPS